MKELMKADYTKGNSVFQNWHKRATKTNVKNKLIMELNLHYTIMCEATNIEKVLQRYAKASCVISLMHSFQVITIDEFSSVLHDLIEAKVDIMAKIDKEWK